MKSPSFSSWIEKFSYKEITIDSLSEYVKPGTRIFLGTGCSEPLIFSKELLKEKYRWFDCHLIHFLSLSNFEYFSKDFPTHFRHDTLSIIGSDSVREAVNSGRSDFTPIKSSEIPRLIRNGMIPIDLAFLQVSPPDQYGYCSLGINVDLNHTVAQTAKKLIVQINENIPYTFGNSTIHFNDIDHFIVKNEPLLECESGKYLSDKYLLKINKIGKYLTQLIKNGSTLNIGLGKIPPKIWDFLAEKQDLAIYSEVLELSDNLIKLIKDGVVNCKKNTYSHIMTSFVLGSREHFHFLDRNPFIEVHPLEFLSNIRNISHNYQLISIYSAISIDLLGNITNHLPDRLYSGIGGEHDFIQGSSLSPQGKTIIAIPSLAKNGEISRITPLVQRCNIPASDVHYIVTEWGIARLAGKNLRERALQIIGVAHPKFRPYLLDQAKKLHLVYEDQILPLTKDGIVVLYPEKYEWTFTSRNNQRIYFRPIKPTDEELYQQFFYKLGQQDRYLRFLAPKKIFPHEQTQKDVNIDYHTNMVILGFVGNEDVKTIVATASYYMDPDFQEKSAEIAITIASDWQHLGLGHHLFRKMIEIGIDNEIESFYGEIVRENSAILAILNRLPYQVKYEYIDDIIFMKITF